MKIVVLDAYSIMGNDIKFDFLDNYDVTIYDVTPKNLIIERIGDADIIFTSKCVIDKAVIDACPNIKYISEMATGYNNIDVQYCKSKNIKVTNVPSYASDNVSEMVFAFLLNTFYNVGAYDLAVKNGEWIRSKDFTFYKHTTRNLSGKTIGIIGYGDTAKEVEKKARAFNMNILINRKNMSDDKNMVSMDYLLENSDIISLHVPLNDETTNLINSKNIEKMKNGVVIINTARGGVIDEKALFDGLESGKIGHACLDVISKEPMEKDSVLLNAKNITITPHIAWAAYETRIKLVNVLKDNFEAYVANKFINIIV